MAVICRQKIVIIYIPIYNIYNKDFGSGVVCGVNSLVFRHIVCGLYNIVKKNMWKYLHVS